MKNGLLSDGSVCNATGFPSQFSLVRVSGSPNLLAVNSVLPEFLLLGCGSFDPSYNCVDLVGTLWVEQYN